MKQLLLIPLAALLLASCVTQKTGGQTAELRPSCERLIVNGSRLENDINKLNKEARCVPSELNDGTPASLFKASGKIEPSFSLNDLTPYAHRLTVTIGRVGGTSSAFNSNITAMAHNFAKEIGGEIKSVGDEIVHPSGPLVSATLLATERSKYNIQIACVVAVRSYGKQGFLLICRDAGLEGDTEAADATLQEIIGFDVQAIFL